jgi:outer membrane protein TolC
VAAEANEAAATAALKLEVARLFIEVWHARKLRDAAQAATQALEAHVATVEAMVEGELRSRADLLASKVALASAQDALIRAEHAVALSQAAYNRRLGAPLSRVPNLAEQLPAVRDLRREDLSQLQTKALAQRAELAAASAGRDALAEQSRAETGKRLPRVAVLAGYQHLESTILDREDFSMVGIGLQWSLFDGGQARSKAAALRRAGEALDWQRKSLQSAIELEVQQHWLGVDAADARALVARDALAQADENLRMARELYAVEMIANGQVLEAVALQQAAAAQATRATMDTVLARLALLRSVGEL